MNIYLIVEKNKGKKVKGDLSKVGKVTILDSGDKDFSKYKQLFNDSEDKIIGVAPGILDWKVPTEELRKIENIKGISTLSSWAHYIDLDYCKKNKIVVTNTPGANSQAVAEYALWMMFSLARKLPLQVEENFKSITDLDHKQTEVEGKTVGIIGLGNIGGRIAKMTKGLGMNVVYWSPKSRDNKYEYLELNELLETSDFVINCVETYEGTKGLLNKKNLSLLKKDASFISVLGGMGWGPEDFDYLIERINTDKLAGLAVESEHEHNYKLPKVKKSKNVFIPGSYAYFTKEAEERSLEKWVEAISGIVTKKYKYRVV